MFKISGRGASRTAGATTNPFTLPTDSNGRPARLVHMLLAGSGADAAHFALGVDNTVTATTSDTPTPLYGVPLLLNVHGYSYIALIRSGGSDVQVHLTAVEKA